MKERLSAYTYERVYKKLLINCKPIPKSKVSDSSEPALEVSAAAAADALESRTNDEQMSLHAYILVHMTRRKHKV